MYKIGINTEHFRLCGTVYKDTENISLRNEYFSVITLSVRFSTNLNTLNVLNNENIIESILKCHYKTLSYPNKLDKITYEDISNKKIFYCYDLLSGKNCWIIVEPSLADLVLKKIRNIIKSDVKILDLDTFKYMEVDRSEFLDIVRKEDL